MANTETKPFGAEFFKEVTPLDVGSVACGAGVTGDSDTSIPALDDQLRPPGLLGDQDVHNLA